MSSIFFTSDLHFGHQNIIRYCNRPWETAEEMDEGLIKRFNETVGVNDTTYILGDISFRNTSDTRKLLARLNGKLEHIKGNHDPEGGFGPSVCRSFQHDFIGKIGGTIFHMYHFPLTSWHHMGRWSIHLHGHIHSAPGMDDPVQCKFDVGVDAHDWKPVSYEYIMLEADKRRQNRLAWLEQQGTRNEEGNPQSV